MTDKQNQSFIRQTKSESPGYNLQHLSHLTIGETDYFDPDQISWINERLGITNLVGAFSAAEDNCFIINTAGEIDSPSNVKHPVDPRVGPAKLKDRLDFIADEIHRVMETTDSKIVVHCYMGMERSVLSVVWYLTKYHHKSMDEAYFEVGQIRPIAIDHSSWVNE